MTTLRLSPRRACVLALLSLAALGGLAGSTGAAEELSASASVARHIDLRRQPALPNTTRVTNTGSVPIGRVTMYAPSTAWRIANCSTAPAGWTGSWVSNSSCTFKVTDPTAALDAGETGVFPLTVATNSGDTDVQGNWIVNVSRHPDSTVLPRIARAVPMAPGLHTKMHVFEVTDVSFANAVPTAGEACPAVNHSALANSSRIAVVCGRNRGNTTLTPDAAHATLGGTMVASATHFTSRPVPRWTGPSVVLGAWRTVVVSSRSGAGRTISASVGSAANQTSPVRTRGGYLKPNRAPVARNDSAAVDEDGFLRVPAPSGLLANDTDPDGDPLRAQLVSGPLHGTASVGPAGAFSYRPDADFNGPDSFVYKAIDSAGATTNATVGLTVRPVDDPPTVTVPGAQTGLEDRLLVFSGARRITVADRDLGSGLISIDLTAQPHGTATLSRTTGLEFVAGDGTDDRRMRFRGTLTAVNAALDGLRLRPGRDQVTPSTLTIDAANGDAVGVVNVQWTPVNDAPTFAIGTNQTVPEDAGPRTVPGFVSHISPGPADEAGQSVTPVVAVQLPGLFAEQPRIVNVNGTADLAFRPAPDRFGSSNVHIRLRDDGGTANGGRNLSPAKTFTITITPVNDPPTFTVGATQTVLEDSGPRTVTGCLQNISAGPVNELQTIDHADITVDNPTLFSAGPAITPTGTLTFTPARDQNGTALVGVVLVDSGGASSIQRNFRVNVTPVNDPPVLTLGANQTAAEDAGPVTVPAFASATPGPANEASQTLGAFTVSTDNPGLFSAAPAIDASGQLTYTPAPDAFGTATATVQVKDNGGTANGGHNTGTGTFGITVTPVNDQPVVTLAAGPTVNEDSGPRTIASFASTVAGPANESTQTVVYTVSVGTNPGLFSSGPAISPIGTLTFTPAADAFGTATVNVTATDNGGPPGIGTSSPVSFTVTVAGVNDPPVLTLGANQTVDEDAPAQTVNGFATATPGPANENTQTVTGPTVTNLTNKFLFAVQPTLDTASKLTYTPAPNRFGASTVTVSVSDDGGGNDTTTKTFTITLNPVNDPPTFTTGPNQTVDEDAAAQTVAGFLTAISPGPFETGQAVSFAATTPTPGMFNAGPAISPTGTLTYTPAPNRFGTATITVIATDTGPGTPAPNDHTSDPQTFTVTLNPVNDPPSFTTGANQTVDEDTPAQSIPNFLTAISQGPFESGQQPVTFTATTPQSALFSAGPTIATNGTLTYTPAPNRFGTATVTLFATDNGPSGAPHDNTSDTVQFTVTLNPLNDAPSFSLPASPDQTVIDSAGLQTVPGFATSISQGPFETGQVLTFDLTVPTGQEPRFTTPPAIHATTGNLTYDPAPGAASVTVVTVTLKDNGPTGGGHQNTSVAQTFEISIFNNIAPVAVDQTTPAVALDEDTPKQLTLQGTDQDDGNLTFAISTPPGKGTVDSTGTVNCTGTAPRTCEQEWTYTPAANLNGTDTFQFTVNDGITTSSPATVNLDITAVNDPPTITAPTSITVTENVASPLTGSPNIGFADIDAGSATVQANLQAPTGTLDATSSAGVTVGGTPSDRTLTGSIGDINTFLAGGNLTFTSAPNDTTTVTLTVAIDDQGNTGAGGAGTATTTVQLNVTPVDDPPSAVDDTATVLEDSGASAIDVLANDTDIDGGPKTIHSVTQPTNGTVTITNAGANLTYQPNPNYCNNPPGTTRDTFTYTLAQAGATPATATVSITVTCVDDLPVAFDDTATVLEESGANAIDVLANDTDVDGGTKLVNAVQNPSTAGGTVLITGGGTGLTYNPPLDYCNNPPGTTPDTFTYTLNGGSTATVTVTVTCVNDAPAGTDNTVTTLEDTQYTFAAADFGFTDPNDTPPDDLLAVTITTLPAAGSLTLPGGPVTAGQSIPAGDIDDGDLVFTPAANGTGTPYTSFTFQVRDDGGTANGGVDLDPTANTLSIDVANINDAPAGTDNTVTTLEDTQHTFAAIDFGFTDPNDTPPNALAAVRITTLPGTGSLTLSGGGVSAGDEIAVGDINSGNLKFSPATNASGSPYTTFTFQVKDDGGTDNGGVDLDASANTMTIDVNPVNDAPAGANNTVTTDEDVLYTFTTADFPFTDPNDTPANGLASVTITTLPGDGSLTLGGSGFAAGTEVSAANITGGQLRFVSDLNEFGTPYTTFTFQVRDDGGTANGGIDLDPTPNTLTINVNPVNDPPVAGADAFDFIGNTQLRVDTGTAGTPHTLETTNSGTGVLHNDSEVEGDSFAVTSITVGACTDGTGPSFDCTDAAVGTVHMNPDGSFSYTPAPGDTGATETFTYTVTDDGSPAPASSVGTATLNRFERVWYVDPNAAGGGNGTSDSPFNSLTALNGAGGAGDSDIAGDHIFIHDGTLTGGIELEASQHLIGEGAGLSIPVNLNGNGSPTALVAAGAKPELTNSSGNAVTVTAAIPIEIVGLSLASTSSANAIDLTSAAALTGSSTLTIANNEIRGAGAEGVDVNLNAGTSGTLGLTITNNSWNTAGTHTGNGIDVNRAAGTLNLTVSNNTNVLSSATAINVNGGSVANTTVTGFAGNSIHGNTGGTGVAITNTTFDATPGSPVQQVDGDTLTIGVSGNSVGGAGIQLTTVQGNLSFDDLDVFGGTTGLTTSGTGTGMTLGVTPASPDGSGTSTILAGNGAGLDITSTTIDLLLADLDSTTTGSGVNFNTAGGQFRAPSGSTITKTSGGGTAFTVANSVSGLNVSYGGSLNVTSGAGISLTNNTGSTVTFNGGMTLSTGTNAAFSATGGGTVNVCDENPCNPNATGSLVDTLTTTTGTALNVANTTIGSNKLEFRSISANGAANGIVLNTTGGGGLTVTGTGTTAGSGGTIQNTAGRGASFISASSVSLKNMNFTSAGTTDLDADNSGLSTGDNLTTNAAIHLQTVAGVTLDRIVISGGAEQGINGNSVSNFVLSNSSITDAGNAADEDSIHFYNMSGTSSIVSTTLTSTVATPNTTGGDDHLNLQMQSGTLNLTISGGSATNANKGSGYLFGIRGTSNATITFNSSASSTGNFSGGIVADAFDTATMNLTVTGSTSSGNNDQLSVSAGDSSNVDVNANGNTFSSVTTGDFVLVGLLGSALDEGYVFDARIENNTLSVANGLTADGILVNNAGGGSLNALISGNALTYAGTQRAIAIQGGQDGSSDLHATVTGNTIDVQLDGTGNAVNAILAQSQVADPQGAGSFLCADIGGAGALANTITHSLGGTLAGGDIRVRQRFGSNVRLSGYGGGPTDTTAAAAYLDGRNAEVSASTATFQDGIFQGGSSCTQPNP